MLYTIIRFPSFMEREADTLSQDDSDAMEAALLSNPKVGSPIPGAGGMRKLRVRAKGRGKSGGARVIYFLRDEAGRIYLCDLLDKSSRENLTKQETADLKALADEIRRE
jgi:hypothetical protein